MCCHASGNFVAVYQLVVNFERVFGVDKKVVEVSDALTKPFEVAVTCRRVPDVVGRYDCVQR